MNCVRCHDTGWITYIAGTFLTQGGKRHEATVEHPIVLRCRAEIHEQKVAK